MIKEFNKLEEIEKYYCKETNTYVFKEDGKWIDLVKFNFNLRIGSNIKAHDINACNICAFDIDVYDINARDINALNISAYNINAEDISASDIEACDIDALNINARNINASDIDARDITACNITANDINYFAACFAYENIKCRSIKGHRENAKHFMLYGNIEIKED